MIYWRNNQARPSNVVRFSAGQTLKDRVDKRYPMYQLRFKYPHSFQGWRYLQISKFRQD